MAAFVTALCPWHPEEPCLVEPAREDGPGADGADCEPTALVHIQRYNDCLEHQDALLRDEVKF
jgi:hypothetical protein